MPPGSFSRQGDGIVSMTRLDFQQYLGFDDRISGAIFTSRYPVTICSLDTL